MLIEENGSFNGYGSLLWLCFILVTKGYRRGKIFLMYKGHLFLKIFSVPARVSILDGKPKAVPHQKLRVLFISTLGPLRKIPETILEDPK